MKKILSFIEIAVYTLGTIGSVAYLLYFNEDLFAVASLGVSAMAFPELKKAIKEIVK